MPILGMVLLLEDPEPSTREAVAAELASSSDLGLGEPAGHRWPAVLEAPDEQRAEARIEALHQVAGIASVDVVYADFEDLLEPSPSTEAPEES